MMERRALEHWQSFPLSEEEHREAASTYRMVERRCWAASDSDPEAAVAAPWFARRADWHARQAMLMAMGRPAASP